MLTIAASTFAVCFAVALIALICNRCGALADRAWEQDREVRRIRYQAELEEV